MVLQESLRSDASARRELGCVREFRETRTLPSAVVLLGYDLNLATIFDDPSKRDPHNYWRDRKWPDFRGRRPWVCTIPKAQRYAFMTRKAGAFMDGYYTARADQPDRAGC